MTLKSDAQAPTDALNALEAAAVGRRVCENARCATTFKPAKPWARFCCAVCRKAHYDYALKLRHIHEYLSDLGKKGAAARKARRKAA